MRVLISQYPHQYLLSVFWSTAILMALCWVFYLHFLDDQQDLFMCFLGSFKSSLEEYLFRFFVHLKNWVTYLFVIRLLYIFWKQITCTLQDLHIFPPILWTVFSLTVLLVAYKLLIFMKSSIFLYQFFFFLILLFEVWVSDLRNCCLNQGHENLLFYFLLKLFIVLAFTFRSMVHFKLIFIYGMRKSNFILSRV